MAFLGQLLQGRHHLLSTQLWCCTVPVASLCWITICRFGHQAESAKRGLTAKLRPDVLIAGQQIHEQICVGHSSTVRMEFKAELVMRFAEEQRRDGWHANPSTMSLSWQPDTPHVADSGGL